MAKKELTKIEKFIKRNERRNKHLWETNKIEGFDYIVCPVTATRLSMLKRNYIEKTLDIDYDEFLKLYPNQKMNCDKRCENITNGLLQIDEETGKTIAKLATEKAQVTLSEIDEKTGLTKNMLRIKKTVASNKANIIDGKNGWQRTAETRNETILENGLSIQQNGMIKGFHTKVELGKISEFKDEGIEIFYRYFVRALSAPLVCKMRKKGYHVDHIFPVSLGFCNKISPLVLSNGKNLQLLTVRDNLMKRNKKFITFDELLENVGLTKESNEQEFNAFVKAYDECNYNLITLVYEKMICQLGY